VKEHGVPTYPVPALNGYTIVLKTSHGTLTYRVDRAFAVAKEDAIKIPSIMATTTPNRVVVITCGVNNGVDIDDNIVVYANLTSSVAV
jgi:sortase (surface protein transpeptidase)